MSTRKTCHHCSGELEFVRRSPWTGAYWWRCLHCQRWAPFRSGLIGQPDYYDREMDGTRREDDPLYGQERPDAQG